MIKIGVVGSRTFTDFDSLEENLHVIIHEENEGSFEDIVIVSGGAPGADTLAKKYAIKHKLGYQEYRPDWNNVSYPEARIKINKYGKEYNADAGFRRNSIIVKEADMLVAFHNGSSGTADTLRKAKKKGIKIYDFDSRGENG